MATVLITGAGRGLGRALAEALVEKGHKLILNTLKSDLWEMAEDHGCRVIMGDVKRGRIITELERVATMLGLDVLINNAAIYAKKPFSDMTEKDIKEMIDVNLVAPIILTRKLWPLLKKGGSGLVMNINSLAGKTGADGETVYCATKHGLTGFTSALQFDGIKDGVRVIDVYLGAMRTDMTEFRVGRDKFIKPADAAGLILGLYAGHLSARISEVVINRRLY